MSFSPESTVNFGPENPTASRRHSGALVISLDFELHWGVCDHSTVDEYRENLEGVRPAVARMLELFASRAIHATWATVGILFLGDKDSLMAALPKERPHYVNMQLSPYGLMERIGTDEASDPLHFAASVVQLIAATPGQEIATHTFSHFYCLEPGATIEALRADLVTAARIAKERGHDIRTIVFPRNQHDAASVEVARQLGITTYRGTERSWVYDARATGRETVVRRLVRLADSYMNITGHHTVPLSSVMEASGTANVRSSRFLRPYSPRLRILEPLRLRRITRAIETAARRGDIYHLWWHPHNFGQNTDENMQMLAEIVAQFETMRDCFGMESLTMCEAASRAHTVSESV